MGVLLWIFLLDRDLPVRRRMTKVYTEHRDHWKLGRCRTADEELEKEKGGSGLRHSFDVK